MDSKVTQLHKVTPKPVQGITLWAGLPDSAFTSLEASELCNWVAEWQAALERLQQTLQEFTEHPGCGDLAAHNHDSLEQTLATLRSIPSLKGDEVLEALPALTGELIENITQHLQRFRSLQALETDLASRLPESCLTESDSRARIENALEQCRLHNLPEDLALNQFSQNLQQLRNIENKLAELSQELLQELHPMLGEEFAARVNGSRQGLLEYATLIDCVAALPVSLLDERNSCFENAAADAALTQLAARLLEIAQLEADLEGYFDLEQSYNDKTLAELQSNLDPRDPLRWFRKDWWLSRKQLLDMAQGQHKFEDLQPLIETLIKRAARVAALNDDSELKTLLGERFKGADSNIDQLRELRSWYAQIQSEYGVGFGPRVFLARLIMELPADIARGFQGLSERGVPGAIREFIQAFDALLQVFPGQNVEEGSDPLLVGADSIMAERVQTLQPVLETLLDSVEQDTVTVGGLHKDLKRLQHLEAEKRTWTEDDILRRAFGESVELRFEHSERSDEALNLCTHTLALADSIRREFGDTELGRHLVDNASPELFKQLQKLPQKLQEVLEAEQVACHTLISQAGLDISKWAREDNPGFARLIDSCRLALSDREGLQKLIETSDREQPKELRPAVEQPAEEADITPVKGKDMEFSLDISVPTGEQTS